MDEAHDQQRILWHALKLPALVSTRNVVHQRRRGAREARQFWYPHDDLRYRRSESECEGSRKWIAPHENAREKFIQGLDDA